MNPIKLVFPKYTAALAQTGVHTRDGSVFGVRAYKAQDTGERLDFAVRAANSFDHALTANSRVPLLRPPAKASAGYRAAKLAVGLLVGSGAIPGARQRVGKQELLAAQDEVHRAAKIFSADSDKHNRYRALDFVDASFSDAKVGLLMVRKPTLALPLLKDLSDARNAVERYRPISAATLQRVDSAIAKATADLDQQIADAQRGGPQPAPNADAMLAQADRALNDLAGAK